MHPCLAEQPSLGRCGLGNEVLKELQLAWQLGLLQLLLQSSLHKRKGCTKRVHYGTFTTHLDHTFFPSSFSYTILRSSVATSSTATSTAAICAFSTSSEPAKPGETGARPHQSQPLASLLDTRSRPQHLPNLSLRNRAMTGDPPIRFPSTSRKGIVPQGVSAHRKGSGTSRRRSPTDSSPLSRAMQPACGPAHLVSTCPTPPWALSRPRTARQPAQTRTESVRPSRERESRRACRKTWLDSTWGRSRTHASPFIGPLASRSGACCLGSRGG